MGEHTPRRDDKFWKEERFHQGKQPNGYIVETFGSGDEMDVLVCFYGNPGHEEEFENFGVAELDGKYYNETIGYMLYADDRYIARKG